MKKTLTGSTVAKITASFLLAISFLVGCAGAWVTLVMLDSNVYAYGENESTLIEEFLKNQIVYDFTYLKLGSDGCVLNNVEWISEYCQNSNLEVNLISDKEDELDLVYCTFTGREAEVGNHYYSYTRDFTAYREKDAENHTEEWFLGASSQYSEEGNLELGSAAIEQYNFYMMLFVNPEFPVNDRYKELAETARALYKGRYAAPALASGGLFFFLICFIFLMCAAGRHNSGDEGSKTVQPGLLSGIPTDVFAVAYFLVAATGIGLGASFCSGLPSVLAVFMTFGLAEVILGTVVCMELAIRMKLRTFWRNTLIWKMLRFLHKCLRVFLGGIKRLGEMIPFTMDAVIVFFAVCIFEFLGLMLFGSGELAVLWILEKMVMFPAVVYFAWMCVQLKKGSAALAEGNLQYKMNTSHMILNFKEQGENLNRIAQGINVAVEQRMKSEHLKTELITNVSHDLKTPLTSIINYADLIAAESGNSETVAEYADVLLRQSKRLKKLLDDLMEASKATTGNLEVTLEPCEIGVLLTQAVGEYEQRFAEKELRLITKQPEEEIRVMADGRHLWRVFDNLLGNICKYALEGSRVYLSVERKESSVHIIFRNMSKYVLDITGEELEERFVRGDKSRHMEGNGLGLSIAKSLMDLQGGRMEVVTDGDLFKVTLTFAVIE
ncbi:MAG: HAMP domain-containing histidine kinase [Bacteroidales bacterium]|nr:HAMP domain-containing histidine kinase [Lachnoclostridium sp.]MCM1384822.1 HAMP domain-containing histidine kinase [Lachnoclostridium sp.]MCM1466423.1 HAMP domain-containing histidine kinase [Bacteroidales bacterium]